MYVRTYIRAAASIPSQTDILHWYAMMPCTYLAAGADECRPAEATARGTTPVVVRRSSVCMVSKRLGSKSMDVRRSAHACMTYTRRRRSNDRSIDRPHAHTHTHTYTRITRSRRTRAAAAGRQQSPLSPQESGRHGPCWVVVVMDALGWVGC
jgi:hypothetical protein